MKLVRLGICFVLAASVVLFGGVEDWVRALIETAIGLLFLVWSVGFYFYREERLVLSPLLSPLAVFSLLVAGQWFFRATASAYNTRIEFCLLLAALIFLFLAVQAFRTLEDWRGFVWFGMVLGFLVSLFAILQHLSATGKLYWFREVPEGGAPFGPYVNRDHFAGFAELILPLALVPIALGRVRKERRILVGFLAVLPMAALILSASRGGIASFGAELGVLVLVMAGRSSKSRHWLAGVAVLLAGLLMVGWLGAGQILKRFSSVESTEVTESKRLSMYRDTWRIFLDHPLLGAGLGTLRIVYPAYETLYDGKVVNHTHNDYLEALAETGILGGLCCAWFLLVLLRQSLLLLRQCNFSFAGALQLSGVVACAGFLVHALVDFNLHIPSNLLLFLLMAHLATTEIPQVPGVSRDRRPHEST